MMEYEAILTRTHNSFSRLESVPNRMMCRASFLETLIRIAKYVFCDFISAKDVAQNENDKVGLNRAFQSLMELKIKQFYIDQKI